MKTYYYKIILFFLLPALVLAKSNEDHKGKYTKEKSLKKEFSVNSDALLKINNDYGNLDIASWNENKIVMEITIKVSGDDEEKVIQKLKEIDVEFDASAGMVSAKTVFSKDEKSWWDKFTGGWSKNLNLKINYMVKVPITNSIDLNNDYGSITLDKIEGNARINCDYGQIIIGELMDNNNNINIDYTNNSTIKYMKSGKIHADYSDFELGEAENIELNADYTQSKIINVSGLDYNCDYGSLRIDNVGSMVGTSDYVGIKIGTVSKNLSVNSDYGSIHVKNLKSSTRTVLIKTDYTGVDISYEGGFEFDFKINTSYGGIKLDEAVIIEKKYKNNSKKEYQGYCGQSNSGNTIHISSSYGGIKLRKKY